MMLDIHCPGNVTIFGEEAISFLLPTFLPETDGLSRAVRYLALSTCKVARNIRLLLRTRKLEKKRLTVGPVF
jgi:hypothetical protein